MSAPPRPDILLIVLDTLRADRLSCYGYRRPTSPHIDAFAEGGVLYERAISPAQWTIPAHASIFTGEYPSTHGTTQVEHVHARSQITLAERLAEAGYRTVGFCNNVQLGVVNNGLDRGFDAFYNYGGALPERPPVGEARPGALGRLAQRAGRLLRRMAAPIEDAFARNTLLLRIAFHPWVIPLWNRFMNAKGNTALSLRDAVGFLRARRRKGAERPLFAFLNLMETHLPYTPPARFVRRFAPYYPQERAARDWMRRWNLEYYRWLVPLVAPWSALQDQVVNDVYDAEVAYEDHLLRHLFRHLAEPGVRDNTLVIVTSDHGEGLNHHGIVGHSLFAYDDLLHVPLIVRYPRLYPEGVRVRERVSARRIYHTILEAAGLDGASPIAPGAEALSLARAYPAGSGADPEGGDVYAEAFPPDTLLTLMAHRDPDALEMYRCRLDRRAVYHGEHKLIAVGGEADELFDVARDPGELHNLIGEERETAHALAWRLADFRAEAGARRAGHSPAERVRIEEDAKVADRLRKLGYLD